MDRRPSSAANGRSDRDAGSDGRYGAGHRADLDAEMFWAPILVDPLFALAAADAGRMKTTQAGRGAPAPKTGLSETLPPAQARSRQQVRSIQSAYRLLASSSAVTVGSWARLGNITIPIRPGERVAGCSNVAAHHRAARGCGSER